MSSIAAPSPLDLVQEFVNTIEPEAQQGDLAMLDGDLRAWCAQNGCGEPDSAGLATLRSLREALRGMLEDHAVSARAAPWCALQPFSRETSLSVSIAEDGLRLVPAGTAAERAIGALFVAIYDAVAAGTWHRLKACKKPTCRWAFYDRSKNGTGAWCSMRVCGNRVKAQKRRQRSKKRDVST